MKIFVEDKFNPRAFGGWFLLPLYAPVCVAFLGKNIDNLFIACVLPILALSLTTVFIASCIGKSYIPFLISTMPLLTVFSFLAIITVKNMSLTEMIIILLSALIAILLPCVGISYYKRALNFFNRKYFWTNTKKISSKATMLRAILWLFLVIVCLIVPIFLILYTGSSIGNGSYSTSDSFFDFCLSIILASGLVFLFGTIIVGYWRIQSLLLVLFISLIFLQEFALLLFPMAALVGWVVISYYGNDNKISFEKVVEYLLKRKSRKGGKRVKT